VCSVRLTAFSGVVETPNFPYAYEPQSTCEWIVETSYGNTINASFSRFDLQPAIAGTCTADYVEANFILYYAVYGAAQW